MTLRVDAGEHTRRGGFLVWDDIQLAVERLAGVMRGNHFVPKTIIGVSRGGLPGAVMLSHLTGAKLEPFKVSAYQGRERRKVRFELPFVPAALGKNFFQVFGAIALEIDKPDTLILDDLWDSGETMEALKQAFPSCLTATLFYKAERQHGPLPPINFPGLWLPHHEWVTFPWELKPDQATMKLESIPEQRV